MVAATSTASSNARMAERTRSVAAESRCLHCRLPISLGTTSTFCCRGCEAVHALLEETGLSRYYELGGGAGHPVLQASDDRKWLEPIAGRLAAQPPGLTRLVLDVQGLHCTACVWLLEELFRRRPGNAGIVVNSAIGSVELTISRDFPLTSYVATIEAFGYRFGPPLKANAERKTSADLVWRMGVCIATAMNTMIFGFAIYCGLEEGRVYRLFHALDFVLSLVSVVVGGSVFFRSAWQSLRRRVLHLDLPIALGIALAFSSSTYTYLARGGTSSYFDTINVFIALMLLGRYLQERVVANNRAYLLASEGAEGLYTRRIANGSVELVRCLEVGEGDLLLLGHQDLVPVDSELVGDDGGVFSLDWINGESAPRTFAPGEVVPAGAFCQDTRGATLRARAAFDTSAIVTLLRASTRRDGDLARSTSWWKRLTTVYVTAVLTIATAGFASWLLVTHDLARTLDVVAAVLIVTCPCAFGIATPLAYELAQAHLRRIGLFVRTPGFLDRAAEIERVVFDKTGTLTTGTLSVANPTVLGELDAETRAIAYDLAARSSHPKSRAIALALESFGALAAFGAKRVVEEVPGHGLVMTVGEPAALHVWRLGSPAWAASDRGAADRASVVLSRDGNVVAEIRTGERARPGARDEVAALAREGYEPWVLSGDSPDATRTMATECGIPAERAFGSKTPEGKAAFLRALSAGHPKKTLFVGDGINDSLVAEEAHCAGTPAIDRPFMAARCDFYFVTPGLEPIREALRMAKRLARVVRLNLAIAIFYNAITITLALAGKMTPLWCAVLMPVSSLTTVLVTTFQLTKKDARSTWTS